MIEESRRFRKIHILRCREDFKDFKYGCHREIHDRCSPFFYARFNRTFLCANFRKEFIIILVYQSRNKNNRNMASIFDVNIVSVFDVNVVPIFNSIV